MFKQMVARIARRRYLLPLVVALAAIGVLITETTYRRAEDTLDGGIALTDARFKSAALLQAMTDHELATKQYLLTAARDDGEWQLATAQAVRSLQLSTFESMRKLDSRGSLQLEALSEKINSRMSAIRSWVQLAAAGQREQAVRISTADSSRQERDAMRGEFDSFLRRGASVQQTARVSLYDALMLNRVAIHALMVATVLATLLLVRTLRNIASQKEDEKARLAALVEERTANLRELAGHLVTAREDERARLARELHDEMGGLLTATKLELARLRRVPQMPAGAAVRLAAVDERLNQGIVLKRRIIENLRPSLLDNLGLAAALDLLCKDVADTLGVPVHLHMHVQQVQVAKDAELTIYRLVQESLTNIAKYAHCRQVDVSLSGTASNRLRVVVKDDGDGFDSTSMRVGSHGLAGMRFRVESHHGHFDIHSTPGVGTVVTADLPIRAIVDGDDNVVS